MEHRSSRRTRLAAAGIGLAAVLATMSPEGARAVVIDFDALPAGPSISGVPDAGTVLTTQLDTLGIVFGFPGVSAGVAVVQVVTMDFSPPNAIAGMDAAGVIPAFATGDIHFRFVLPGTGLPGVTDSVSFQVGDSCCDTDSVIVNAYDIDDHLLDSQVVIGSSFQPYALATPGIHRIHVVYISPHTGGYTVDDLAFATPTAVPAPGAIGLFAVGGIALAARRRLTR